MLRFLRWFSIALLFLVVFLAFALLAMRFAIHGREVHVPKLVGLTPNEAERVANQDGLVISIENRYYSNDIPRGRIVSQMPPPGSSVRRGWRIQLAESLGPQHAGVPNLVGQSEHAAEVNLYRHSLEIGDIAVTRYPELPADIVIAQNPSPEAKDVLSPRIALALSPPDNSEQYVMPSLLGEPLAAAADLMNQAGFKLAGDPRLRRRSVFSHKPSLPLSGTIAKQYPLAGQKVSAGTTVYLLTSD